MSIQADAAATALVETWQHLLPAFPQGWALRDGGAIAGASVVGIFNVRPHPRTGAAGMGPP